MAASGRSQGDCDALIVGGGIAGASLGAEIAPYRRTRIVEAEAHCGYHSTGRSAAFWLESYGGPAVTPLASASRAFLAAPPQHFSETGFLRPRGAVHVSQSGWAEIPAGVEVRSLERDELERLVPGIRPQWGQALFEPSCADIDVGGLHSAYLRSFRQAGGEVVTGARLASARRRGSGWAVELENGERFTAAVLINAGGAWADDLARRSEAEPLGIAPKRRTMVQLRVGRSGLRDLPLITDAAGSFYFKGEGDATLWLSPHDEIETDPCDAAPEEIDVATAIDRFQSVVDWPVERVERSWAGLRSFAPDRVPVYGWDASAGSFFWFAGLGGFGIQTAPAAAKLAAALILGVRPDPMVAAIDPSAFEPARFARA